MCMWRCAISANSAAVYRPQHSTNSFDGRVQDTVDSRSVYSPHWAMASTTVWHWPVAIAAAASRTPAMPASAPVQQGRAPSGGPAAARGNGARGVGGREGERPAAEARPRPEGSRGGQPVLAALEMLVVFFCKTAASQGESKKPLHCGVQTQIHLTSEGGLCLLRCTMVLPFELVRTLDLVRSRGRRWPRR